ncbi:MAG: hypothetical protein QXH03_05225, partial [Candidatus Bathyarchaeia archaeon]
HMNPLEVNVFSVWNITPSIAIAPEAWVHTYTVYVEYIVEGEDVRRLTGFGPEATLPSCQMHILSVLSFTTN